MNGLYDELRLAIHSIWNRRWLALGIAWAICLLGWLVVALIPNSYESKAKVEIRMAGLLNEKVGITAGEQRKVTERLKQTLSSSDNLAKVVRGTDLGRNVVSDQEVAGKISGLRKNIEVKSDINNDNILTITAIQPSPKDARDVVQKLIDVAEEDSIAGDRKETSTSIRFLDKQLEELQKKLADAEAKRVAFETNNLGMLPGVGSASTRMEAARAELSQIDSQLIQARSALAAMASQLSGTPQTFNTPGTAGGGGGNPALAQAQGELAAMRAKGLTDNHPDVISTRNQIAILRTQGGGSAPGGSAGYKTPNPAYAQLQMMRAEREASVSALTARKAALQSDMAGFAAKQSAEPGVSAEYGRINRDYEVLKIQYDKLLTDREEIRLRGQVGSQTDAVQFVVNEPPMISKAPVSPNRPLFLAMVLFAGLGAGAATAFALGHLQTSYPTAAKLERASGLPVIGSISQMLTSEQRTDRKKKLALFFGGSAALIGVCGILIIVEFIQRGLA
ncbi:MAG: XrtA system polysaccharide chain length determinant [Sphingorhabdus sp.]